MEQERLDKILSGTGRFSRNETRRIIAAGLVTVDGAVVRRPEAKVSRRSEITVKGETIDGAEFVYYMMNKPAGYVSASKPEGRYPAVTELLPEDLQKRGLFCAGRLDADVTGLLLLTDDGVFAHRVTAPRGEIPKTYRVKTDGPFSQADADALAAGTVLRGGVTYRPARLVIDAGDPAVGLVTVTEGKFHEVKNLLAVRDRRIRAMERISVGALSLDPGLAPGQYRRLTEEEAALCFASKC